MQNECMTMYSWLKPSKQWSWPSTTDKLATFMLMVTWFLSRPQNRYLYHTIAACTCESLSHIIQFFSIQSLRSTYSKFQLILVSSVDIIALDNRVSKKIDLYSKNTEKNIAVT